MSTLVTVAVPVYNGARYINQTIDSALAQTYPHLEIIVIDDGSTDSTATAVQAYSSKVQYIHQKNQGVAAARNHALRLANGKYIVFLDADDLWKPGYLDRLVPLLEHRPDVVAAYCGYQYIDLQNNLLPQHSIRVVDPASFYATIVAGNFIAIDSVLIQKKSLEQIGGFNSKFQGNEDTDILLRLPSQGFVIGIQDILVLVRANPYSLSSDPSHMAQDNLRLIQHHFGLAEGDPHLWPPLRRTAYCSYYFWIAIRYLQIGNLEIATQYVQRAFLTDPSICGTLDTFYELSLADQPRGMRGDFKGVDLENSHRFVFAILDGIFRHPDLPASLTDSRAVAYANACYALGLLAYGKRDLTLTRSYLLQAMRLNSRSLFKPAVWIILLKTFLGVALLNKVTGWRRSFYSHAYTRSL